MVSKILKHITTVLLFFIAISVTAQQGINYKALIKDGGGNVVASQGITVQFTILQGAGMTNVYQETHTPNTDANGIVIVNIGEGAIDSGVYANIDWGADDHYLNVQINTGGGLTDMGTTQFMAMPYALQAANATSADNGIPSGGIEGQILRIVGGVPVWVGSELDLDNDGYSIGDGDCNDNDAALNPSIIEIIDGVDNNCDGIIDEPVIGQFIEGGVVFWVDPIDNNHGLVCAIIHHPLLYTPWYNGSYIIAGTQLSGAIGTGSANTDAIIAAQGPVETDYAAGIARAYAGGGFNDWFLPSIDELVQMKNNKAAIDAATVANGGEYFEGYYWSSTETLQDPLIGASWLNFYNNNLPEESDKAVPKIVRAVRAF